MLDFAKAIRKAQYLKAQMLIMQNKYYKFGYACDRNLSDARMNLHISRSRYDQCMSAYCLVDSDLHVEAEK